MNTTVETRTEALRRLAQVARESGVKLMRDTDGDYWATSVSEPGMLYRLEPESCGCRGFAMHRRCRHVAALHAHLGYLDPEPPPPAGFLAESANNSPINSSCTECSGVGTVPATISTGSGKWAYGNETCSSCHGVGTISAAA